MYFVIDGILIALLICVFWFGIKKGLMGNWIFSIVRTILALGIGGGVAVGVYFLMNSLGFLSILSDGVVNFFGNVSNNVGDLLTQENFIKICMIIAFVPFGVLGFILGYVFGYWLLGVIAKVLRYPIDKLREIRFWKVIDNILGSVLNLAVLGVVVLAVFGIIHGLNTGDTYKTLLGNAPIMEPFNHSVEVVLNGLHENLSAGPLCGFIYENNPLNSMFVGMF